MTDVFTTLTMVKMRLNDGEIPAMEELTDRAKEICDPEFTPGMGALDADPETTKLRCPVRGCGEYYHRLGYHIDRQHKDLGGRERVKRALSLPASATLISERGYESIPKGFKGNSSEPPTPPEDRRCTATTNSGGRCTGWTCEQSEGNLCYIHWVHADPERSKKHNKRASKSGSGSQHWRTRTGQRNFNNTCRAQIAQRILSIRDRIRRAPSMREADKIDPGLPRAAERLYGSWTAALADCNLQSRHPHEAYEKDDLIALAEAFVNQHGRLPRTKEAGNGAVPPVPAPKSFKSAFDCKSWATAMRRVAYHLDVDAGPYDLSLDEPIMTSRAAKLLGLSRSGAYQALCQANVTREKGARYDGKPGQTNYWELLEVKKLAEERSSG